MSRPFGDVDRILVRSQQSHSSGAHHFEDPEGTHQIDERDELLLLSGDFNHHVTGTDVDDASTEDIDEFLDLAPLLSLGADFHQHEVSLDKLTLGEIDHAHHRDQLFQLFANLIEHAVVAADHECDPRELGVFRLADGQTLDIECARSEHSGDLREDSRLVNDQCGEDVFHEISRADAIDNNSPEILCRRSERASLSRGREADNESRATVLTSIETPLTATSGPD